MAALMMIKHFIHAPLYLQSLRVFLPPSYKEVYFKGTGMNNMSSVTLQYLHKHFH